MDSAAETRAAAAAVQPTAAAARAAAPAVKYNYHLPLASIFRMPMLALHVYTSHVDFTFIVNIYLHPLADSL